MQTVRVEGFGNTLRGEKIWLVGAEHLIPNRLHVLDQELLGRGRKVLILADSRKTIPRWATKLEWDAIFRIREAADLRLAITYIVNGVKPIRVVWCGEEPSNQLLKTICVNEVSFIGHGSTHPKSDWSLLFFSNDLDASRIEEALLSRMGSVRLSALNLKSVLMELRAAKASLVWSSIEEEERSGGVYWYDVAEGEPPVEQFNPGEAADFMREIADRIASAK